MEKGVPSSLFVNYGSFMERFKQLQQQKDEKDKAAALEESKPPKFVKGSSASKLAIAPNKIAMNKPTLVAPPLKLAADDEEEEDQAAGKFSDDRPLKRKKLAYALSTKQHCTSFPNRSYCEESCGQTSKFCCKNGWQFEHVTRSFSTSCSDYKYYEYPLAEEEKALLRNKDSQSGGTGISASKSTSISCRSVLQQSSYPTPASALYENNEEPRSSLTSVGKSSPSSAPPAADPITMMEFYMKKAAEEEKMRLPKQPKDEMLPPPPLQDAPIKKGHHMGDYIPPKKLEKFLAACNDAAARKTARETAEKAKI
ncbi:hypothetical protein ERO13_A08G145800v2 [Gossypium hirsutum]|nr:hypothetical protein ERO13_A08G145800v2 [Gossypium hirsutum]